MSRILVRFNTLHKEDEQHRKWRVLTDGTERLADSVKITVPCETIMEEVGSVEKYHFVCDGIVEWEGDSAVISSRFSRKINIPPSGPLSEVESIIEQAKSTEFLTGVSL
jgi:hypothetical protein